MADDILSQFLVRIAYAGPDSRAYEFGAKIGALPTIVSDATMRDWRRVG